MKGYKVFEKAPNDKLRCRNYIFDEENINELKGEIELCKNGFHFCTELNDCFNYYGIENLYDIVLCEVEASGIITDAEDDCSKRACSHIKIIRRIPLEEFFHSISNTLKFTILKNLPKLVNDDMRNSIIDADHIDLINSYDIPLTKNDIELLLEHVKSHHYYLISQISRNSCYLDRICHLIDGNIRYKDFKEYHYKNIKNSNDILNILLSYDDIETFEQNISMLQTYHYRFLLEYPNVSEYMLNYILSNNPSNDEIIKIYKISKDRNLISLNEMAKSSLKSINSFKYCNFKSIDLDSLYEIAFYDNEGYIGLYILNDIAQVDIGKAISLLPTINGDNVLEGLFLSLKYELEPIRDEVLLEKLMKLEVINGYITYDINDMLVLYPNYTTKINELMLKYNKTNNIYFRKWLACNINLIESYMEKNPMDNHLIGYLIGNANLSNDIVDKLLKIVDKRCDMAIEGKLWKNHIDKIPSDYIDNLYFNDLECLCDCLYSTILHKNHLINVLINYGNGKQQLTKFISDFPEYYGYVKEEIKRISPLSYVLIFDCIDDEVLNQMSSTYDAKSFLANLKKYNSDMYYYSHEKLSNKFFLEDTILG